MAQCVDRGFLTLSISNRMEEVPDSVRTSGGATSTAKLLCFRNSFPLQKERESNIEKATEHNPNATATLDVIQAERPCLKWYPWTEHFDPGWHYQEFRMLQLEKDRREWEERLEKDRREFDLKLFKISQTIQEDSKEIARSADRFNRRITCLIILLAAVEVVGTITQVVIAWSQ